MPASAEPLRLAPIARDVVRAYGHHWRLLMPLAVVVLLPQAIADALLGDFEIERLHTAGDYVRLAALPATAAINLAGEAIYAGIVAAAVVHWRRDERFDDVGAVARELPLGRLIVADLILAIGTAVGFVLLIVPGILFFTYFVISPALIELRRLSVRDALETSVRLVRGSFWRVLGFAVLVIAVTDVVGTGFGAPVGGDTGELVLNLLVEAALQPFQGLATVLLALALLHRDPSFRRRTEVQA